MHKPSYTAITVERRGDADWVTLNRPGRRNSLDHAMVDDLLEKRRDLRGPASPGSALYNHPRGVT
jgi:enoyl-CoA hydratase/carnithine racemase